MSPVQAQFVMEGCVKWSVQKVYKTCNTAIARSDVYRQPNSNYQKACHTLVGKSQHTLGAVEIGCLGLQQTAHEGIEERHVQQTHNGEAHTGDQG